MSSEAQVIVATNMTKTYRIGIGRARVREMVPPPIDRAMKRFLPQWWEKDTFNALDEVSLSVERGSAVGVIGPNGAGKTTLLKVIAGVTAPTKGDVVISGRVAALLDVVVGFHADLTGRENVYLLGAVHGLARRAIESRMEEILRFAEIEELADTPLKRYSSGMVSRLGFATITALDADVLLVDEVLAVGDATFQQKCIRWLDAYRSTRGTLVIVSHNLALIRSMTKRVVWLDHGRVAADAPTDEALALYVKAMERRDATSQAKRATPWDLQKAMQARGLHRWGAGGIRVEEVSIQEPDGDRRALDVLIRFRAEEVADAVFSLGFIDEADREIGSATSPPASLGPGEGAVRCAIRPLPLRPGIYFPVIGILSIDGVVRDQWRLDRAVVVGQNEDLHVGAHFGPIEMGARWSAPSEGLGSEDQVAGS